MGSFYAPPRVPFCFKGEDSQELIIFKLNETSVSIGAEQKMCESLAHQL